MINDFELANISNEVYKQPNSSAKNKGYEELDKLNITVHKVSGNTASSSGFFAALVEKDGEYGIGIRGTDC